MTLSRIACIASWGLYGLSVAWASDWPYELVTHFRPQQFLFAILLGCFFYWIDDSMAAYGMYALALLIMIPFISSFFSGLLSSREQMDGLEIAFLNAHRNVEAVRQLFELSQTLRSDIVFLVEVNNTIENQLREVSNQYPYQQFEVYRDTFGLGLVSKIPFSGFQYATAGLGGKIPWVEATLHSPEKDLFVWIMHATRPTDRNLFEYRNKMLRRLAKAPSLYKVPSLVVGDFNVSPGSPYFQEIIEGTGWRVASRGNPFYFTWPSGFPFLLTSIDHMFYRSPLRVLRFSVGPNVGSDHYPLFGQFQIKTR